MKLRQEIGTFNPLKIGMTASAGLLIKEFNIFNSRVFFALSQCISTSKNIGVDDNDNQQFSTISRSTE